MVTAKLEGALAGYDGIQKGEPAVEQRRGNKPFMSCEMSPTVPYLVCKRLDPRAYQGINTSPILLSGAILS